MKIKNWFTHLLIMGFVIIIVSSCKKDENNNNNNNIPNCGIVTDADGNTYNTVTIGTQCWLRENLKTTKYRNGSSISNVTDGTAWNDLSTPAYCWYNNDISTFKSLYGALYNWYAVNTGNLCPNGWHVPSEAEWTTLIIYLGGNNIAADKLKEVGTTHWENPNTGTNSTGFTALPGGERFISSFLFYGSMGIWWSSTEESSSNATERGINGSIIMDRMTTNNKEYGLSVRCMKN